MSLHRKTVPDPGPLTTEIGKSYLINQISVSIIPLLNIYFQALHRNIIDNIIVPYLSVTTSYVVTT